MGTQLFSSVYKSQKELRPHLLQANRHFGGLPYYHLPVNSSHPGNLRSPAALARFVLTCIAGLAIDLFTKVYAGNHLLLAPPIRLRNGRVEAISDEYSLIPGWIHFHFTVNQGAVFGIGQGQRWLFIIVSLGAIAFLTYLFAHSGRQRIYQVILGMLLAGVLGNMYDRFYFGYVRDMIYALPGKHWPEWFHNLLPMLPSEIFPWIFNFADMLLCTGVFLILMYSTFFGAARKPAVSDPGSVVPSNAQS